MLFRVPVEFSLKATRVGGERIQTANSWSLVDVEMHDYDDADVPVVLSWRQDFQGAGLNGEARRAIGASPVDGAMHVRKFGEHFYEPVLRLAGNNMVHVSEHGQIGEFLTGDSTVGMLERFEDNGVFGGYRPGDVNRRRLRRNGGDGFREYAKVEWHDLEKKTNALRNRAGEFLLVGGVFHKRCDEPQLVVFSTGGCSYVHVTTSPSRFPVFDRNARIFEIEDYKAAASLAKKRNRGADTRDMANDINLRHMPSVDDPDSIYAPEAVWMRQASRATVSVVNLLGGRRASEMTDEIYGAYSSLYKSLYKPEDDERYDMIAGAMADLVEHCEPGRWEDVVALARPTVELLDARPVNSPLSQAPIPGI